MQFRPPMKSRKWIALALGTPLVTLLVLISGIFTWSPLNCWHEDIDINSGRVRYTRYLLYLQIDQRVTDTWLSRAVPQTDAPADWRRVNTFSPGVHHSPHYRYHGAINQVQWLERIEEIIPFDPDARRKVADAVLALWQETGSDSDADDYVQQVAKIAFSLHDDGVPIVRASDIPAGKQCADNE